MKNNVKKFRSLLQKALQQGGECNIDDPLPLEYLLNRVHLKSIACHYITQMNGLFRAIDEDTEPSVALEALTKMHNDCNAAMIAFNETIDFENSENN